MTRAWTDAMGDREMEGRMMSTKGEMTRAQAVAAVGESAVDEVESKGCDFTGRVQCDGDSRVEFSASVRCEDREGYHVTLIAYYYQDQADLDGVDDLGNLEFDVEGYDVV